MESIHNEYIEGEGGREKNDLSKNGRKKKYKKINLKSFKSKYQINQQTKRKIASWERERTETLGTTSQNIQTIEIFKTLNTLLSNEKKKSKKGGQREGKEGGKRKNVREN